MSSDHIQYTAPASLDWVKKIFALLSNAGLKPIESPTRGLDHGAWVPLLHLFPHADIPVIQVSLSTRVPMKEHLVLGRALGTLRRQGVLILGSGNLTHNLQKVQFSNRFGEPESWAKEFDQWACEKLEAFDLDALADYVSKAPSPRQAHPTDDHYTPLLVAAAAAGEAGVPE